MLPMPSALLPVGAGLAPGGTMGHVVYRLLLPTPQALIDFGNTTLTAGGVFLRTQDIRPPGTPAILIVVHPESHREFHIPGEVKKSPKTRGQGVAIGFDRITDLTMAEYRRFAEPEVIEAEYEVEPAEDTDRSQELAYVQDVLPEESESSRDSMKENTEEVRVNDLSQILLEAEKED